MSILSESKKISVSKGGDFYIVSGAGRTIVTMDKARAHEIAAARHRLIAKGRKL